MRHHVLMFSDWDELHVPVDTLKKLTHPNYMKIEASDNPGHGNCPVEQYSFVGQARMKEN